MFLPPRELTAKILRRKLESKFGLPEKTLDPHKSDLEPLLQRALEQFEEKDDKEMKKKTKKKEKKEKGSVEEEGSGAAAAKAAVKAASSSTRPPPPSAAVMSPPSQVSLPFPPFIPMFVHACLSFSVPWCRNLSALSLSVSLSVSH